MDPDADNVADNYAGVLREAGYEVDVSGSMVSGNSSTLSIDAVVRPPAITLQVMKRDE
ncbi:hypothetical protein [Nocardioides sp. AE5]|uniref:hypothetical protein n=1 Tax=Nocardioides sp. AE5 TaxID=2962573 RepID=UPI0028812F8D|nr:hypothetical protein [Nocardioides sp. AE5]MDT0200482.1 hypothetical protein [Nocardioides sp. AE5]